MKVLVIGGGSGLWLGGKQMLILERLREAGYEVVHKTPEELEAERPKPLVMSGELCIDECFDYEREAMRAMLSSFKPERCTIEPKPKHQPKGPRGRWGKLK